MDMVRDRVRDRDIGRVRDRVRLRGLAIAASSYSGWGRILDFARLQNPAIWGWGCHCLLGSPTMPPSQLTLCLLHNWHSSSVLGGCNFHKFDVTSRFRLRSASGHLWLCHDTVPALYGRPTFDVAGLAAWNSLSDNWVILCLAWTVLDFLPRDAVMWRSDTLITQVGIVRK